MLDMVMGKVCIYLAGVTLALFIGAQQVQSAALQVGLYVSGGGFLLTGIGYLYGRYRKYQRPLDILGQWRCTYWPKEGQLMVTVWINDYSHSAAFHADCVAQFGRQTIEVNDRVNIGDTYFGKSGLVSGSLNPIMLEFQKYNIRLDEPNGAIIKVKIKPSDGVWLAKEETHNNVAVQVIQH